MTVCQERDCVCCWGSEGLCGRNARRGKVGEVTGKKRGEGVRDWWVNIDAKVGNSST